MAPVNPNAVTCGAVLFSPRRSGPVYFGMTIPGEWCVEWHQCSGEQVIAQAELFPNLVARWTWPELFRGAHVISFIDSDPGRFAPIKGFRPVVSCSWITTALWKEEAALGVASWFDRVPGASNVADGPSRLDYFSVSLYPGAVFSSPVPPPGGDPSLSLHPLLREMSLD